MKRSQGFTLLEMIVAIGIFAVIATISFASLDRFIDDQDRLEGHLEELKRLQLGFTTIARDMQNLVQRPVRDGYGDAEPALMMKALNSRPDELLRITTLQPGGASPGLGRLLRVAYRFDDDALYRISWPVLDRDQDSPETRRLLLSGLREINTTLLMAEEQSVQTESTWSDPEQLPDGVEWRFILADGREFHRVFEVRHAR